MREGANRFMLRSKFISCGSGSDLYVFIPDLLSIHTLLVQTDRVPGGKGFPCRVKRNGLGWTLGLGSVRLASVSTEGRPSSQHGMISETIIVRLVVKATLCRRCIASYLDLLPVQATHHAPVISHQQHLIFNVLTGRKTSRAASSWAGAT